VTTTYIKDRDEAVQNYREIMHLYASVNHTYSAEGFKRGHDHGVFKSPLVQRLVEALEFYNNDYVHNTVAREALAEYQAAKKEAGS